VRYCIDTAEHKKSRECGQADILALAAFISRPQAVAQIGAQQNKTILRRIGCQRVVRIS
jgi:hypothetical protein